VIALVWRSVEEVRAACKGQAFHAVRYSATCPSPGRSNPRNVNLAGSWEQHADAWINLPVVPHDVSRRATGPAPSPRALPSRDRWAVIDWPAGGEGLGSRKHARTRPRCRRGLLSHLTRAAVAILPGHSGAAAPYLRLRCLASECYRSRGACCHSRFRRFPGAGSLRLPGAASGAATLPFRCRTRSSRRGDDIAASGVVVRFSLGLPGGPRYKPPRRARRSWAMPCQHAPALSSYPAPWFRPWHGHLRAQPRVAAA